MEPHSPPHVEGNPSPCKCSATAVPCSETIHTCPGEHDGVQGPREGECKLDTAPSIPAPALPPAHGLTRLLRQRGRAGLPGWPEAGQ